MPNGEGRDAPFGRYIEEKFGGRRLREVRALRDRYRTMDAAASLTALVPAICGAANHIDQHLVLWRRLLGGVTPFSTFRGNFLEEVTLRLARLASRSIAQEAAIRVVKLTTGEGIVAGVSLAFRHSDVPDPVPVVFRRDREDVIVGLERTLSITAPDGAEIQFPHELVPICVIACKMYVDATRLENVLAKVKNLYAQYSTCRFMVVAEWDALGGAWHDAGGRILDSLLAPLYQTVFLRGDTARRPANAHLRRESLRNPYRASALRRVYHAIRLALRTWQ